MERKQPITAVVVVAHPDDETLWAGGTILMHPDWQWTVVSLCRRSDPERRPRFQCATQELGAVGVMGDLNDGPEQLPLSETQVQQTLLSLLSPQSFNLILTHSPDGEYTRHRRHEETSQAVIALWEKGLIRTNEVWLFAYADSGQGGNKDLPRAIETAHLVVRLPDNIWHKKYHTITEIYGFSPESYEACATPREEAFWCFRSSTEFREWLEARRRLR